MSRIATAGTGGMPCPVLKPLSLLETRYVRVDRQVCILGAHPRVHLPLPSAMVSRTHALIVTDAGETYVRDLASRNGVYVNGHAVRERRLRHGDLLCVGPYAFWWGAKAPGPRPRNLSDDAGDGVAQLAVRGERQPREMTGRTFVIGGRECCDMQIDHEMVDNAHAVVYRRGAKFHLRDLNSRTGTFVNGRRVRDVELRRGDQIRIGLMLVTFEPPMTAADLQELSSSDLSGLGLTGGVNADHPPAGVDAPVRSCPTIEQLLGAPPARITQWERRRQS